MTDPSPESPSFLRRHGWNVVTAAACAVALSFIFSVWYRPLPVVGIDDVAPPPEASVTVSAAMPVERIAANAYGSPLMAEVVKRFNRFRVFSQPRPGAVLQTPSLPKLFQQQGLDPRYQPMVNVLAKCLQDFRGLQPGPATSDLLYRMAVISRDLETAGRSLQRAVKAPHTEPKIALGHFRDASQRLREVVSGVEKNGEYDLDFVLSHLAAGFGNLLGWVQQNYE